MTDFECDSLVTTRLLYLNNEPIQTVQETKMLGIIFDSKRTFIPRIKYLQAKCLKALNLLRVVAHPDWGADYTALMRIYTSCIRSKLDYESIVYASGRKSYLQPLDQILNQTLKLCLVCLSYIFKSTIMLRLTNFLLISEGKTVY